jgi:hypothetical protein
VRGPLAPAWPTCGRLACCGSDRELAPLALSRPCPGFPGAAAGRDAGGAGRWSAYGGVSHARQQPRRRSTTPFAGSPHLRGLSLEVPRSGRPCCRQGGGGRGLACWAVLWLLGCAAGLAGCMAAWRCWLIVLAFSLSTELLVASRCVPCVC